MSLESISPPRFNVGESLASTPVRDSDAMLEESAFTQQRLAGRAHTQTATTLAGQTPTLEAPARATPSRTESNASVLSARQFGYFLERERQLADRGTRRFSLLVLRRPPASPAAGRRRDAFTEFARQVCTRLRSTDLVGRVDTDCVEILLTDTGPAGANVVAAWVAEIERKLGLDLEHTIYVYPSVVETSPGNHPGRGPHDGTHTKRPDNAQLPRRHKPTTGERADSMTPADADSEATQADGRAQRNTRRVLHGPPTPLEARALADQWPMEDLWPRFSHPIPIWKRSLDIAVSSAALLVLSPLFLLLSVAIPLDSKGPMIFRQLRAGRGGRPFVFYKFRSMIADAEAQRASLADQNEQDGPIFKIRNDLRITRLGRLLRRGSIDELPQLWNVLKGDISLVGPRSPLLDEVSGYERWQRRRLSVVGGITCIWQVSGRSDVSFRDWMRLDMRYLACRNLWLDLKLMLLTVPAVISGRGAS